MPICSAPKTTPNFESKAAYVANADDPAQDAWYRQLRTLLRADPQWEDAEGLLASPRA